MTYCISKHHNREKPRMLASECVWPVMLLHFQILEIQKINSTVGTSIVNSQTMVLFKNNIITILIMIFFFNNHKRHLREWFNWCPIKSLDNIRCSLRFTFHLRIYRAIDVRHFWARAQTFDFIVKRKMVMRGRRLVSECNTARCVLSIISIDFSFFRCIINGKWWFVLILKENLFSNKTSKTSATLVELFR